MRNGPLSFVSEENPVGKLPPREPVRLHEFLRCLVMSGGCRRSDCSTLFEQCDPPSDVSSCISYLLEKRWVLAQGAWLVPSLAAVFAIANSIGAIGLALSDPLFMRRVIAMATPPYGRADFGALDGYACWVAQELAAIRVARGTDGCPDEWVELARDWADVPAPMASWTRQLFGATQGEPLRQALVVQMVNADPPWPRVVVGSIDGQATRILLMALYLGVQSGKAVHISSLHEALARHGIPMGSWKISVATLLALGVPVVSEGYCLSLAHGVVPVVHVDDELGLPVASQEWGSEIRPGLLHLHSDIPSVPGLRIEHAVPPRLVEDTDSVTLLSEKLPFLITSSRDLRFDTWQEWASRQGSPERSSHPYLSGVGPRGSDNDLLDAIILGQPLCYLAIQLLWVCKHTEHLRTDVTLSQTGHWQITKGDRPLCYVGEAILLWASAANGTVVDVQEAPPELGDRVLLTLVAAGAANSSFGRLHLDDSFVTTCFNPPRHISVWHGGRQVRSDILRLLEGW